MYRDTLLELSLPHMNITFANKTAEYIRLHPCAGPAQSLSAYVIFASYA